LADRISKLIKGSNILIDIHHQILDDYSYIQAAQAARAAREKRTQRRVIEGGVITVDQARYRIINRADKEADLEARRAEKRRKRARIIEKRIEE
jgi:hypothetical protein